MPLGRRSPPRRGLERLADAAPGRPRAIPSRARRRPVRSAPARARGRLAASATRGARAGNRSAIAAGQRADGDQHARHRQRWRASRARRGTALVAGRARACRRAPPRAAAPAAASVAAELVSAARIDTGWRCSSRRSSDAARQRDPLAPAGDGGQRDAPLGVTPTAAPRRPRRAGRGEDAPGVKETSSSTSLPPASISTCASSWARAARRRRRRR